MACAMSWSRHPPGTGVFDVESILSQYGCEVEWDTIFVLSPSASAAMGVRGSRCLCDELTLRFRQRNCSEGERPSRNGSARSPADKGSRPICARSCGAPLARITVILPRAALPLAPSDARVSDQARRYSSRSPSTSRCARWRMRILASRKNNPAKASMNPSCHCADTKTSCQRDDHDSNPESKLGIPPKVVECTPSSCLIGRAW
mmetsp:Transcript_54731/g.144598  ORF Transcript_54731/g.144598 Transcript_54731/m.144598 type:complete len:204 (-) Transcript_54731:399-1010(-)